MEIIFREIYSAVAVYAERRHSSAEITAVGIHAYSRDIDDSRDVLTPSPRGGNLDSYITATTPHPQAAMTATDPHIPLRGFLT